MGGHELSDKELMLLSIMKTCRMIDKNFLLQEHFLKVRLKVREITEFKEPLTENKRKIKEIQEAIRRSILASTSIFIFNFNCPLYFLFFIYYQFSILHFAFSILYFLNT